MSSWRDYAVRSPNGKTWVFEHSSAHEGGDDVNPNLDIGFAMRIERVAGDKPDLEYRGQYAPPSAQSFLDQLSPYPTRHRQ